MDSRVSTQSQSRTLSEGLSGTYKKLILSGKYGPFDFLFPLLDQITQETSVPNILYWIVIICNVFQIVLLSIWPFSTDFSTLDGGFNKVLSYFVGVFLFVGNEKYLTHNYVFFAIITVLFFLFLIASIAQLIAYNSKRTFTKWILYFIRFIADVVINYYIIPTGCFAGYSLQIFIDSGGTDIGCLVYSIFSIVYFIFYSIIFVMNSKIFAVSPFLPTSPIVTWESRYFTFFMIMEGIFGFCASFVKNFFDWVSIVLFILHMVFIVYTIDKVYSFYFVRLSVMKCYLGAICTSIVLDVVSIIYFFVDFPTYVFAILFVVFFIVSIILSHFSINYHKRKVVEILSLEHDEAEQQYELIGLKSNPVKASFFIHIGLMEMSSRLIDFTLLRYLITQTDSLQVYAACLKLVCFFPQESRFMSQIFQTMISRTDLTFAYRFLMYQTQRIKAIRQSSSSLDSNDSYQRLVQEDKRCHGEIISFWKHIPTTTESVTKLSDDIQHIESQWTELLNSYPNNTRFREEYVKFIVDCKSDFTGGILQKYKIQQIDQGRNFATDKSFKFFVANYPQYLKKKVIDYRGNFLLDKNKKNYNSIGNSSNSSNSFTDSSSNQISAEIEDTIGRTMFKNSRTRIALQNAFYNRRSTPICFFKVVAIYVFVIQVVAAVVSFLLFNDIFPTYSRGINEAASISELRTVVSSLEFYNYINWANIRGLLGEPPVYDGEQDVAFGVPPRENIDKTGAELLRRYNNLADDFYTDALDGIDIYQTASLFVKDDVQGYFCEGFTPFPAVKTSLQKLIIHVLQCTNYLIVSTTPAEFNNNRYLCEIAANAQTISTSLQSMYDSLRTAVTDKDAELHSKHNWAMIIFAIALFVLIIPISLISLFFVYREDAKLLNLMKTFTETQIQELITPILIDIESETSSNANIQIDKDGKSEHHVLSYIGFFILQAIFIAVLILTIYNSYTWIKSLDNAFDWTIMSSLREPAMIESISASTLSILLNVTDADFDPSTFLATSISAQNIRRMSTSRTAQYAHNQLVLGGLGVDPCKGINDEIDQINGLPSCDVTDDHSTFKCGSFQQVVDYIQTVTDNQFDGLTKLEGESYFLMPHGMFNHQNEKLDRSTRLLVDYGNSQISRHNGVMLGFLIILIVIALIILLVSFLIAARCNKVYTTLLHLLLRMTPSVLTNNIPILNFLLKRDDTNNDGSNTMSTSMKIIYSASDPIISVGNYDGIEYVNKAVTGLLGYTPEQLLGQNFSFIFDTRSNNEVVKQIQMMKNDQSSLTYESHIKCISDNNCEKLCHITLLGMSKSGSSPTSFVFILRDEEELMKRQTEAEEAKKKSEYLLYQILPMDIVLRLNRGEKNISLVVPSATIIFIDVQRFSDYASSLSPPQIMGALSLLFGTYDTIIQKYNMITKIKLIGDDYMAAGGLFNPNDPPQSHAEQVLKFALDVLAELDEVNNKLSSNLCVRIGINTGGPIIAGVLGTDKPTFDIIGDPINVAARLQSTDIAGKVQISADTYELVSNLEVNFEKRNDVFLKGKGQCSTYLVSPLQGFSLALSASALALVSSSQVSSLTIHEEVK